MALPVSLPRLRRNLIVDHEPTTRADVTFRLVARMRRCGSICRSMLRSKKPAKHLLAAGRQRRPDVIEDHRLQGGIVVDDEDCRLTIAAALLGITGL
jgi:hypothetical protein